MNKKCPSCESGELKDIPFSDYLGEFGKTLLNPVEIPLMVGRAYYYTFRRMMGQDKTASYIKTLKCLSCQSYATQCPHCDNYFKLSTLPKIQSIVICPKCSQKIYYDLPG